MVTELDRAFAATHTIVGIPVMRNPDWRPGRGTSTYWIDAEGNTHRTKIEGDKAVPLFREALPAATLVAQGEQFGVSYGSAGEIIPSEWWLSHYSKVRAAHGVMVTREAAAAALRACAWPDSAAPCGQAGNSNDDDASFDGKDSAGNCIVRLFVRGKGYFKVRIPAAMFLEIVDE